MNRTPDSSCILSAYKYVVSCVLVSNNLRKFKMVSGKNTHKLTSMRGLFYKSKDTEQSESDWIY